MAYITIGDERIFYARHTSADSRAPHLILVHGAGGNHQFWGRAIRNLRAASTYALDLPGHGRSSGTGRWSIADYASFIVDFMDSLRLEQAIICGHSMGGATAIQMVLGHSQRVSGLVLVGTGARLRVLPAILDGTLSSFEDTIRLICEYAYSPNASAQLVQQGQRQMLNVAPQTVHDDFAACNAFDVMERVGEIRCPTLVICGTKDALTPPKYAAFLAERIAGAELKLVEGAGHMVMIEEPNLVAGAIESALTRWKL
jgi:pimeloyl-ACP methyl ester carboxylesterase